MDVQTNDAALSAIGSPSQGYADWMSVKAAGGGLLLVAHLGSANR